MPTSTPGCRLRWTRAARGRRLLPADANEGVFGAIGPHLHPTFARRPRAHPGRRPSEPRTEPIPVVVLGRYVDPVGIACSPTSRDCGQAFAVERVVWVAGTPWGGR